MGKIKSVMLLAGFLAAVMAASGSADTRGSDDPADYTQQTTCPVMGGAVDSTVYTDIQGQRVYFCCPGCIETFRADPEKYFKKAAEDRIIFQNIQKTCPVTGEPIDGKTFRYYLGRGIYFCCPKCLADFDADPMLYLMKMDKGQGSGKSDATDGASGKKED